MMAAMHTAGGFDAALVEALLDDALASGARVYGISGLQGSGKSTLATQIADAGARRGLRCAVFSIDDANLTRAERQRLAREAHPLLATRGPPGTHDVALAAGVLDSLRAGRGVALPRFDKRADDRVPAAHWPRADAVALVLFEGWFLGTPAEDADALVSPLNALERDEDGDGRWRRWCNAALARDYPPLWRRIDRLLLLQAPAFDMVRDWRWQAEQEMARDAAAAARAMDRARFDRFVKHYERVSRQALRTLPGIADAVVRLDPARRPVATHGLLASSGPAADRPAP